MVAQHTTSTGQFIPADNWRAAPDEAPGGALTAVGVHSLDHMIEFAGRVRDVRCVTARHIPGHSDDTTTVMLHFESGATGLIFCSVATATNFLLHSLWRQGPGGDFKAQPADVPLRSGVDAGADRPGRGAARRDQRAYGFDMLNAQLTAFACCIRDKTPYPVPDRRRPARDVGVRRNRGIGAHQQDRRSEGVMTLKFVIAGLTRQSIFFARTSYEGEWMRGSLARLRASSTR